jgi:hypothetical protein
MKKIAAFFAFYLLLSAAASAQQNAGNIRFGFQTSPTWSWMRTSDKRIEGIGSNWGIKIGALGEYYFAPNYAIMSGLGFGLNQGGTIQNGYERGVFWPNSDLSEPKFDTLSMDAKLHYRVNYVEIPIGLRMRGGSNEDSRMKFYAEVPVFTFGFATKAKGDIRGTNTQNTEDENIREDVNGLSLSWGLGGGIEYELATSATLVAGLSYQQQFTDLTSDKGVVQKTAGGQYVAEKSKGTMGMISLRVGIFF